MEQSILDLEALEPGAARKQIETAYGAIRSARIRAIFCDLMRSYFQAQNGRLRRSFFVGIQLLDRRFLERTRLFGDRLKVRGAMLLVIPDDVSAALAADTIESLTMLGMISAPEHVWQVLKDRCRVGIWQVRGD